MQNFRQYLFVIRELNKKEISHQNSETILGNIWNILNPLLFMIVMSGLYSTIFAHDIPNYEVYFFIGFTTYSFVKESTVYAMTSLTSSKRLLVNSKWPMQIFVTERVASAFLRYLYSLVALCFLICFFRISINICVLCCLPVLIFLTFFVIGVGEILSILYVFFADIEYLYTIVMTVALFASALFYPVERLSLQLQKLILLNPIYLATAILRKAIMAGEVAEPYLWIRLILISMIFFVLGTAFFSTNKSRVINKL